MKRINDRTSKSTRTICQVVGKHSCANRFFFRRLLFMEALEPRIVLDGDALNVIAHFEGDIESVGQTSTIPISINEDGFTSPSGNHVLGFKVSPAAGSQLDPGAVRLFDAEGQAYPLTYARNDAAGGASSVVVAELAAGEYSLEIFGEDGSSGQFVVGVYLAGDLDGDGKVLANDRLAIVNLIRSRSYAVEADANLDGVLTSFDATRLMRNYGITTSIQPLTLEATLSPGGTDTLPDGTPVTEIASQTMHGQTLGSVDFSIDFDSDGAPELQGFTAVDGSFTADVTLTEGLNTITVSARDSFGQTSNVATTLKLDLGPAPPTIVASLANDTGQSDADGLTNNPLISGLVTDEASGLATLEAAVDGGDPVRVSFDAIGNFTFNTGLPLDGSADGPHTVQFEATNLAGKTSTEALSLTLDTILPVAPSRLGLKPESDTGASSSDGVTSSSSLIVTGDSAAGANAVEVVLGVDGQIVGSVLSSNLWEIPTGTLSEGFHQFTAVTIDAAGNTSLASVPLAVEIDRTTPRVPSTVKLGPAPYEFLQITYNDEMAPAAFDAAAYTLVYVGGPNDGQPIPIASVARRDATTVDISLGASLADGQQFALSIQPSVGDVAGNRLNDQADVQFLVPANFRVTDVSPADGDEMVNLTREIVIRFSDEVHPATITPETLRVLALGNTVAGRHVVSSTKRFVTFFPDEPWPASTEVRLQIDGSRIHSTVGSNLDANADGFAGDTRAVDFTTLPVARIPNTNVFGFVRDSFSGNPIVGATIRVDAIPESNAVTDEDGRFELSDMPAPEFFVHVDGSTATNAQDGFVYPNVGKPFHSVPGQTVQLNHHGQVFDVYLPPMALADVQTLSADSPTEVGFGDVGKSDLVRMFPEISSATWDLMSVTFEAGAAVDQFGNPATQAAIIPVPPDRLPAPLPPGLDPQLVISVQALGATNFDIPAPITFPNLDGLAPGAKSAIFSFNHDAGRFEVIGTGTVSDDGLTIVSDPDVGLVAPGWHLTAPVGIGVGNATSNPIGGGGGGRHEGMADGSSTNWLILGEPTEVQSPEGGISLQGASLNGDSNDARITPQIYEFSRTWDPPAEDLGGPVEGFCLTAPCGALPQIEVTVEVEGPLQEFMKFDPELRGASSAIPLLGGTQTLTAPQGIGFSLITPQIQYGIKAKTFEEMFGRGGLNNVQHDTLFGAKITITEKLSDVNGRVTTSVDERYIYRFVGPSATGVLIGSIRFFPGIVFVDSAFPKAIAGSVTQQKEIEFRMGNNPSAVRPTLRFEDDSDFDCFVTPSLAEACTFEPSTSGPKLSEVAVVAPDGAVHGALRFFGNSVPKQKWFIDEAKFASALAALHSGSVGSLADAEKALIDTDAKRRQLVADIVARAEFLLDDAGLLDGIQRVPSYSPSGVNFDVWLGDDARVKLSDGVFKSLFRPEPSIRGQAIDAELSETVDNVAAILENISNQPRELSQYRLGEAINPVPGGVVDMYLDNIYRSGSGTLDNRLELINSIGKTIAHELGHHIGLPHTRAFDDDGVTHTIRSENEDFPRDVMSSGGQNYPSRPGTSSGWDFFGEKRFILTDEAFKFGTGLPIFDVLDGNAFELYSSYLNEGGNFDTVTNVSDGTHGAGVSFGGAVLMVVDAQSQPILTSFGLGGILADGPGGEVAEATVQLQNLGDESLTIDNIILEGDAGFLVSGISPGTSLAVGETLPLVISLDPAQAGPKRGLIRIQSNALGGEYLINLSGIGRTATADIQMDFHSNNFGGLTLSGQTIVDDEMFTLSNQGLAPLTISNVVQTEGQNEFVLSGFDGSPVVLETGESITLGVSYNASSLGLQRGRFQVQSDDPQNPVLLFGAVGTGIPDDGILRADVGNDYTAIDLFGRLPLRTVTNDSGKFDFFLPAESEYTIVLFDPVSGLVATGLGLSPATGESRNLTQALRFTASVAPDSDFDGLPDDVEFATNSSIDSTDTDGDGIDDFNTVLRGLSNTGAVTGAIANLPLPGVAEAVAVDDDLVFVATGFSGLAIVDASQFDTPILLGQIDLAGIATGVGVDPRLSIAAVATGSALQLVDFSDPMAPALIQSVTVGATQVNVFDGLAYATSGTTLSIIDLISGDVIQNLALPGTGSVTGLAREATTLYAFISGSDTLATIDISVEQAAEVLGQVNVSVASGEVGLFAGSGVVWLAGSGLRTIDVSDPRNPILIHGADTFFSARRIALNGSGLGLLAPDGSTFVEIYDVTSPNDTDNILLGVPISGGARDVAISRGVAYVGTSSGLEVVNYLPFDNQGRSPTALVTSSVVDEDAIANGIQVTEGRNIPIQVEVMDDVQVGFVELIVNGTLVATDVSFPFDFAAPAIGENLGGALRVQVRATDTGGNTALSNQLFFEIVPDTFAPAIVHVDPADGASTFENRQRVQIRFTEALDVQSAAVANFQLIEAGPDSTFGSEDDTLVQIINIQLRSNDSVIQLATNPLPIGNYQIRIDEAAILDRAGNSLGAGTFVSEFTVNEFVTSPEFYPFGTAVSLFDDDSLDIGPLPFPFEFFGQALEGSMSLESNGVIEFGNSIDGNYDNFSFPSGSLIAAAPYFDDVNPGEGGSIGVFDGEDVRAITWQAVPYFGRTGTITFQIAFHANGVVEIRYGDMATPPGGTADAGISVGTATIGLTSGSLVAVPSLGNIANKPNVAITDNGGIVDAAGLAVLDEAPGNDVLVFTPNGTGNYTIIHNFGVGAGILSSLGGAIGQDRESQDENATVAPETVPRSFAAPNAAVPVGTSSFTVMPYERRLDRFHDPLVAVQDLFWLNQLPIASQRISFGSPMYGPESRPARSENIDKLFASTREFERLFADLVANLDDLLPVLSSTK